MKFRKKPVVIEAEQFLPDTQPLPFDKQGIVCFADSRWFIQTLEGPLNVTHGDWIIKGVAGEFYPCKPGIFEKTYDPIND